MTDPAKVAAAIRPTTRLVWLETPSNPMLKIFDIAEHRARSRAPRGVPLARRQHVRHADAAAPARRSAPTLVVHSATKYLNGHSDVVGGRGR